MHLIVFLTWLTLAPVILLGVAFCGCFVVTAVLDYAEAPKVTWEPGGPWVPKTLPHLPAPAWADPDPAQTRPLPPHLMYAALAVREQTAETERIKRQLAMTAGTMQKRKD
jgi:hypothetical protein